MATCRATARREPHDRRDPDRRHLLAGAPRDVRHRADPRRAVHQLRPPRASTSRPTVSITPREALASAGATLRSLVDLVASLSDEPQGLELGEVAGAAAELARPRPADRGPRPVRASAQLPQAGADQHDRRAAHEDRGRPAEHHQLRAEEPRRGQAEARRARPDAARLTAARNPNDSENPPCPPHAAAATSAAAPRTSG